MTEPEAPPPRNRWKDFWQLDVPLALVLITCTVITIVEIRRASDGIWRAWVYSFEWPLIGLFCIWMWYRFRTEGNPVKGMTRRWQERVREYEAEHDTEQAKRAADEEAEDPDLRAWRDYQRRLAESERER